MVGECEVCKMYWREMRAIFDENRTEEMFDVVALQYRQCFED
jgi:hypothetical protein